MLKEAKKSEICEMYNQKVKIADIAVRTHHSVYLVKDVLEQAGLYERQKKQIRTFEGLGCITQDEIEKFKGSCKIGRTIKAPLKTTGKDENSYTMNLSHGIKAKVLEKCRHIVITDSGCFQWAEVVFFNRTKQEVNDGQ